MLSALITIQAQVTIGSSDVPIAGALLQLKDGNYGNGVSAKKGLMLPRVSLSKIANLFPMFGKEGSVTNGYDSDKSDMDLNHVGLVVYNVATVPEEGICPGVYTWTGDTWIRIPEPCASSEEPLNSPNSYIVPTGGSIEIPCGKPYLVAQTRADVRNVNLTDKVYVELLWQDTQGLISKVEIDGENKGPYSTIKVTANPSVTGNAVVAIRMGATGVVTDPIVWSWHIWVTDFNPDATAFTYSNGEKNYTIMDRNLGAIQSSASSATDIGVLGLVYQWGRKDPFTAVNSFTGRGVRDVYNINDQTLTEGTNGIMPIEVSGTITSNLQPAIENPMNYYFGAYDATYPTPPFDWYTTTANGDDELWGNSGAKSAFDPCPEGWRVPAYSSDAKGPWYIYEYPYDAFSSLPPYYSVSTYGVTLNVHLGTRSTRAWGEPDPDPEYPAVSAAGFYPFGKTRAARHMSGTCVGCDQSTGSGGGTFGEGVANESLKAALFWTAKAGSSTGYYQSQMTSYTSVSRAQGNAVRCVKDE